MIWIHLMYFGWRNLGEQAGRAIGIHTIYILMSRTYVSTIELFVCFSVGSWTFTDICSKAGLPTFFICSWPPTDDVSHLQVFCRCFCYLWVSQMALGASMLFKQPTASSSWIWSQPTPQGRRDQKWDFCVCLEELISGIWMCQDREPQGSEATQLWGRAEIKDRREVVWQIKQLSTLVLLIPSSFHLFPVSSTGADTTMDHAENSVSWV